MKNINVVYQFACSVIGSLWKDCSSYCLISAATANLCFIAVKSVSLNGIHVSSLKIQCVLQPNHNLFINISVVRALRRSTVIKRQKWRKRERENWLKNKEGERKEQRKKLKCTLIQMCQRGSLMDSERMKEKVIKRDINQGVSNEEKNVAELD